MNEETINAKAAFTQQGKPKPQPVSILAEFGIAYRVINPNEEDTTPRTSCGLGNQCCHTNDGPNYN